MRAARRRRRPAGSGTAGCSACQQALAPQMQVFARGPGRAGGRRPRRRLPPGGAGRRRRCRRRLRSQARSGRAVMENTTIIRAAPSPLMPKDNQRAWVRLPCAFGADEFHQAPLPRADLGRHRVREALGLAPERSSVPSSCLPAGSERQRWSVSSAALAASIDDDGLQSRFDGGFHPDRRRRLAPEERAHAVTEASDVLFQGAEELPGPDEVLPARQHFAAQQGAVAGGLQDPGHGVVGRRRGRRLREHRLRAAVPDSACAAASTRLAEGADRAVEGAPGNLRPSRRRRRPASRSQTRSGSTACGRQHPSGIQRQLRHHEQLGRRPALPG